MTTPYSFFASPPLGGLVSGPSTGTWSLTRWESQRRRALSSWENEGGHVASSSESREAGTPSEVLEEQERAVELDEEFGGGD
jgi:hypothetical protein